MGIWRDGKTATLAGSDTLAEINANFIDGTVLDDSGDPRDPNVHAARHATGQPDALAVADIGGDAAGTARPASTVDGVAAATVAAGAGLGATASQPGHTQAASTISDSTIPGRALLTAATIAAQKTALAITTGDLANSRPSLVDYYAAAVSVLGNYSVGTSWITQQAVTIAAIRFRTAIAGAHNQKLTIWVAGVSQATVSVACPGPTVRTVMLSTPLSLAAGVTFVVSMYDGGTSHSQDTTMTPLVTPAYDGIKNVSQVLFAAGDAAPAEASVNHRRLVQPIVLQRALGDTAIQPLSVTEVGIGASPYSVVTADRYLSVTGATTILLLPCAAAQGLRIKNAGAGSVTVTPNGAETIEGVAAPLVMLAGESFDFQPVAANYEVS